MDVQACRLRSIDGLHALENLQSLHISHNQIEKIENLDANVELETVDLSGNPIQTLTGKRTCVFCLFEVSLFSLDYLGFEKLLNIEDLWMNDCKIEDFKQIEALTHMKRLKTVYLERNPIYRDPMYRKKIMLTLPQGRFYRILMF